MIQEKDFLYRVPVKTAPITTPGGQIRNPEILVDVEGGEFMHGNILDANSTSKLVNQSVKEAVDNKLIESGYVTKDLLEAETTRATEQENSLKTLIGAETSARTKGDEDLSSKIKAEQTRAEGKEKEISDKLAIVNGDSNTEGSFRKAIADVVAAAPEDLDTLKEIADKLAGNDDLHTALNQAITEKADASALLNEVTRATGVENNLKTAIDGKQPKGNYLTEHQSLEEYAKKTDIPKVDTSDFISKTTTDAQSIISTLSVHDTLYINPSDDIQNYTILEPNSIQILSGDLEGNDAAGVAIVAHARNPYIALTDTAYVNTLKITREGISNADNNANHVYATDGSIADLTQYAKKAELPVVPTKTSQLTNDSNFITAVAVDEIGYTLQKGLKIGNSVENQLTIGNDSIISTAGEGFSLNGSGITFNGRLAMEIPTAGGSFVKISSLASAEDISNLSADLSKKQDKGSYVAYSSEDDDNYYFHRGFVSSNPFIVDDSNGNEVEYGINGITATGHPNCFATTSGFKSISDFVLKSAYDEKIAALEARIAALEAKYPEATA